LFFLYAALVGISLSTIFHIYTESSITRVFFILAAAFGALSIWGHTTQRNLSGFGTFLFMGLIGIIIASLVNLFLRSSGLDWMISIIGVGVFAGLTAYPADQGGCTTAAMTPLRPQGRNGRAILARDPLASGLLKPTFATAALTLITEKFGQWLRKEHIHSDRSKERRHLFPLFRCPPHCIHYGVGTQRL
jgi:hypothetical protein